MAPVKPMLGEIELQLVQKVNSRQDQSLSQHGVPALDGDFLQRLGRCASRITLNGVMTGTEAGASLKTLREQFRTAAPVSFVEDIATATKVDEVIIEEMCVRELAGKPERFAYALTLREYLAPPPHTSVDAPEEPVEEVEDDIDEEASDLNDEQVEQIGEQMGTIEVHVELGDAPDYSGIIVLITEENAEGEPFTASTNEQVDGVYRFTNLKAASYTVEVKLG